MTRLEKLTFSAFLTAVCVLVVASMVFMAVLSHQEAQEIRALRERVKNLYRPSVSFSTPDEWRGCWRNKVEDEWGDWECTPGCRMLNEVEACCR